MSRESGDVFSVNLDQGPFVVYQGLQAVVGSLCMLAACLA